MSPLQKKTFFCNMSVDGLRGGGRGEGELASLVPTHPYLYSSQANTGSINPMFFDLTESFVQ